MIAPSRHVGDGGLEEARGAAVGLEPRCAKLRIQAVPFPILPEDNNTGLDISGDRMLFQYQILIENLGDTAVQLMGRYHEITCPWDVIRVGTKAEPRGHRSDGVIILPGSLALEHQHAVVEGSEATLNGGFLVRHCMQHMHAISHAAGPACLCTGSVISSRLAQDADRLVNHNLSL
jgi:hypothetical protein